MILIVQQTVENDWLWGDEALRSDSITTLQMTLK